MRRRELQINETSYASSSRVPRTDSNGLRIVSLLLIVSVSFVFSNCSPRALTGGNRPPTPPYWLFAAFSAEPESQSVPTGGTNNPASPSSGGFGGSGGGSLSAGTPRLGMYFFHPDHTGSISMVTDGAGRMMTDTSGASQLTYKPYGEVNRMNSYGPDIFRYKYTSQQDDQDTGLYYYNARYYDPVLGSFTSADNVTNATSAFGLNHYMYTEGNPVRYGDASGNFLIPLLMAAMAYAVVTVAVVTVAVTIAAAMAVVNTVMTVAAMAQTAAIATAAYAASAVMAAVRFAIFVDALGVVGAGVGFVAGGLSTGTLHGALAGAEIGFKIGTGITIAAWITVGAFIIGAYVGTAIKLGIAFLGLHTVVATVLYYTMTIAIGALFGQLAKAIGRNAGGHLDPGNRGFKYNKKSAYRGEAAGDFLSNVGNVAGNIWDQTKFTDKVVGDAANLEDADYYHSLSKFHGEVLGGKSFYFIDNVLTPIVINRLGSAIGSELANPQPHNFGNYQ